MPPCSGTRDRELFPSSNGRRGRALVRQKIAGGGRSHRLAAHLWERVQLASLAASIVGRARSHKKQSIAGRARSHQSRAGARSADAGAGVRERPATAMDSQGNGRRCRRDLMNTRLHPYA